MRHARLVSLRFADARLDHSTMMVC
jgi:hypothetical protein